MLPSHPRAGRSRSAVRQPTMSQQRSASRPRERYPVPVDDDRSVRGGTYASSEGGYGRQMRSQRSMGSMRTSRNKELAVPPPPPPPYPKSENMARSMRTSPATYSRPPPSRDSDSSGSSISSSGSSFLDRMRNRGTPSSSSQSSFELDLGASKETGRGNVDTRKPVVINDANDLVSYGYSIWNRVATAASTWSWNGTSYASITGVAPSSGDSEITRALKSYHIGKARDRSDLPDWLFDEHERGVNAEMVSGRPRREERSYGEGTQSVSGARGRGFRDIYDNASSTVPEPRPRGRFDDSGRSAIAPGVLDRSASRVTDRLKAMREARRPAATAARVAHEHVSFASDPAVPRGGKTNNVGRGRVDQYDRHYEDSLSSRRGGQEVFREPVERKPPGRVGLPTNPRRR